MADELDNMQERMAFLDEIQAQAQLSSLDIPVGGYLEIYRDPAMLAHPYPEDALAHAVVQELMLVQQLLEMKRPSAPFPA